MALLVPEKVEMRESGELFQRLGEALESLLEFIGAAAGWVGLRDSSEGMTFPVRRGDFPENWLRLQQARGNVWGFAVRQGPTLLNDLRPWATLGEPPLRNLLSCPLGEGDEIRGHIALVNKPQGFASQDAAVLQGMAHHMVRLLRRQQAPPRSVPELPAAWRHILDRAAQGILILDESGTLVYANAVWLDWTGFRAEDVLGRMAPYPFWVGQHDLVRAINMAGAVPASALPFRRRDQSLLWCQVETLTEQWNGRMVTLAFLRQTAALSATLREAEPFAGPPPAGSDLPFGVAVTNHHGRILWSNTSLDRLTPGGIAPGQRICDGLGPAAAAILEQLVREPRNAQPGRMGSLIISTGDRPLCLFWLTVRLSEGPGFLFALTNEPEGFPLSGAVGLDKPSPLGLPLPNWLALLLEADGGVDGWEPRWEKLTGLSARDVQGSRSELVLDWLFPQQQDRERVSDCFHQPVPKGCQIILEIATPVGGRPLLCTFLPLPRSEPPAALRRRWLLLVGEPELFAGPGTPSWGFVRQFSRGLEQVLLHNLRAPAGLARLALARTDLTSEVRDSFRVIDASCRHIDVLIEDLANLSLASAGECPVVSLAGLVREFLDEQTASQPKRDYELTVELPQEATPVRVDPQLLRVVLRQLLLNAEQALVDGKRRIDVRVRAELDAVRCEIQDTGEGLPIDDWTRLLTPFFSTKGAFARDVSHAVLEATGLGLTVSRHLLALMGGQLELRSVPSEGTTVLFTLPRADRLAVESGAGGILRADSSSESRGPHPHSEQSSVPQTSPFEK